MVRVPLTRIAQISCKRLKAEATLINNLLNKQTNKQTSLHRLVSDARKFRQPIMCFCKNLALSEYLDTGLNLSELSLFLFVCLLGNLF